MRIDLHLHSTASDGACQPEQLIRAARAGGLDVVALTDHDTTAGLAAAMNVAQTIGIRVIPGIEISTTHAGAELHILGYHVNPASPTLRDHTLAASERRTQRMQAMIGRLLTQGLRIDLEDVLEAAGDTTALGRPHLARALVLRGYVRNTAEAFERFLADGRPAYLPTELLTPRAAIDLVQQAGGLAIWAHPPLATFEREARTFLDWGLHGFECFRPNTTPPERRLLTETAAELDALRTGGSDWHGPWHGALGTFFLTPSDIPGFLAERTPPPEPYGGR